MFLTLKKGGKMPCIVLANSKSSGKTTIALNLAHHLKPDLIIDLEIHNGGFMDLTNLNDSNNLPVYHTTDINELLHWLQDDEKLILVDTGGFDLEINRIALTQSDLVITPTNDDATDQLRLIDFNQTMIAACEMVNKSLTAYALINRVHHSRRDFPELENHISTLGQIELLPNVIPQSAELSRAAFSGQAVKSGTIAAKFAKLAKDIKKMLDDQKAAGL